MASYNHKSLNSKCLELNFYLVGSKCLICYVTIDSFVFISSSKQINAILTFTIKPQFPNWALQSAEQLRSVHRF